MAERPEDLNLPNSVVSKIIKEALPEGVNVSKDARLAISKAASVFVLYSTSCANNFAMQHKRKTISGQDVLDAMKEMEFERFVEPLKRSLEAYKEQKSRKDQSDGKTKKDVETTATETTVNIDNDDGDEIPEEIPDDDSVENAETAS